MPVADAPATEIAAPFMVSEALREFDLANIPPPPGPPPGSCAPDPDGGIVVCAQIDSERHRMRPLENSYEDSRERAEIGISENSSAKVEVESVKNGNIISRRVMVRFKLDF